MCSSCGLADELAQETKGVQKAADKPKSACGSVRSFELAHSAQMLFVKYQQNLVFVKH